MTTTLEALEAINDCPLTFRNARKAAEIIGTSLSSLNDCLNGDVRQSPITYMFALCHVCEIDLNDVIARYCIDNKKS